MIKGLQTRRLPRRWVIWFSIGIITLTTAMVSLTRTRGDGDHKDKLFKVERRNITQSLQLSGKTMPEKTTVITAQQSGRIVAIDVKEGAQVQPNDLLFTMQLEAAGQTELMDLRNRVRALDMEVESGTKLIRNKNSVRDLIGRDIVAREKTELEKKKIELTSSRERLAILENSLGLSQATPDVRDSAATTGLVYVRSPTQGIVSLIDKRPGDFVLGGGGMSSSTDVSGSNERMVMVVSDMTDLQVRIKVMEADLYLVKQGQPVKVRLDAYPKIAYEGTVEQIGGQGRADQKAGYTYFDVYVSLNKRDSRLLPEMNATVDLVFAEQQNVLTLPVSCVLILPNQSYVRVNDSSDPNGFRFLPVQVGAISDTEVEIVSGLAEGAEVLDIDFASPQVFEVATSSETTATKEAVKQ
ncbi:efflux RND transporter periplasmic adaptor subunit [Oligoflexus tunisiensis]|uniref:efflux RND transporter periplasmic adaptor subunit n=1 Tax=Oligoflexus tunisiensis TaxID=708132 RepID=UPI000AD77A0C|nr:efflux RND transporter periplasmic adaptor subunit [Oligoflexus tunisiensis]